MPRNLMLAALLTISWPPDNNLPTLTREPATDMPSCMAAARAAISGRGLPLNRMLPAYEATCIPTSEANAGFPKDWDCIANYNCK